jgi:ATP-dependent DNA ligase
MKPPQVHVLDEGARIETFSRNSECTTGKYPDVVRMLRSALKPETKSVVVDSEVRRERK